MSGTLVAGVGLVLAAWSAVGCLGTKVCGKDCTEDEGASSRPRRVGLAELVPVGGRDKVDVLLVVDGSASMGDKQALLASAVPALVSRLLEPLCVEGDGAYNGLRAEGGSCEAGLPEFLPVSDLHLGVISSNLGASGADGCDVEHGDDRAWLLPLVRPELSKEAAFASGFLEWNARDASDVGVEQLSHQIQTLVTAVGENGCGFEASLEAWYRFLVDPAPSKRTFVADGRLQVEGTDTDLLQQRAAFLRPDSLVLIVGISDENDCSIGDLPLAWQTAHAGSVERPFHMPRGTSACATEPDSPCCRSCAAEESKPPAGCGALEEDRECKAGPLSEEEDPLNLRCYDQKRRFGVDLLYPTARYVRGLTQATVLDRHGEEQPNPLLVSSNGMVRDPRQVIFAGILGVPWQDLATPSSLQGEELRYLDARALENEARWALLLPGADGTEPQDPHMVETPAVRQGRHPFVADAKLVAPSADSTQWDVINGREHESNRELQYACVFPLEPPQPCLDDEPGCDCATDTGVAARSPLCLSPEGDFTTTQYYGKAFPATRQLEVLRDIGTRAALASVCPKHVATRDTSTDPNYGYNPAVGTIVDRFKASQADQCLPEAKWLNADEELECFVWEVDLEGDCDCDGPGRSPVEDPSWTLDWLSDDISCDEDGSCADVCACSIAEAEGGKRELCRSEIDASELEPGYCYIDPANGIGSPDLVEGCPASEQRLLRIVGANTPRRGMFTAIACLVEE